MRRSPQLYIMKTSPNLSRKTMKNLLLTGMMFLSMGATINAQNFDDDDARTRFTAGVKAGLNVSNVWDAQNQDWQAKAKAGFAGGIFVGIPIGAVLGIQPEVLFSQKGFRASGTFLATEYSFSRTTSYVDFPIQLQIKPAEFVTLLVGPQFSFLVHQTDVFNAGGLSTTQQQEFTNDQIRKNILGLVTGADVNISHFVISGRLGWDMMNNNGDGTSNTPRYKNRWAQLTLGMKI